MVMTAIAAVATCCGSIAAAALRGGSPVAVAVIPVTLGALDERLLVGTDASDLRSLAGTRGGTVGATLRTQNGWIKLLPLKNGASGGAVTYLKVEKPHFLFFEGSTGGVAAAGVATVALPNASVTCVGTSATRAASSVDRPAAGDSAPAPGACSSTVSAALDEGAQAPTSQGGPPPVTFFLLFLPRR
jgi:hypothetical protein